LPQRGQAHVLDRIGVKTDDNVVEEGLDRGHQEVAHRHIDLAEPVVLTPLLVIVVAIPQIRQLTAQHGSYSASVNALVSSRWLTAQRCRAG
jgi:hypothetical protein